MPAGLVGKRRRGPDEQDAADHGRAAQSGRTQGGRAGNRKSELTQVGRQAMRTGARGRATMAANSLSITPALSISSSKVAIVRNSAMSLSLLSSKFPISPENSMC